MRISILLPFRNAAPWIQETLDSIIGQTYQDWELIAVNDQSEDATEPFISSINDGRIRVLKNEGQGIIPALQTGLRVATGTYLTRMDADDIMPSDKLEQFMLQAKPNRLVVTGKVQYFGKEPISEGYEKYAAWLNERCDRNDHFEHIYRECIVASPNWLATTKFIREDRIFEQLQYPEDYDMTFLWKQNGYSINALTTTTHLWREHPKRTSRNSEVYDQASFFQLKLDWFQKTEQGKTLGIFGTGIKGKRAVTQLKENFSIHWFDYAFERFQAPLDGYKIEDPTTCTTDLLLIAVYPENREPLEQLIQELGYVFGENVWYV